MHSRRVARSSTLPPYGARASTRGGAGVSRGELGAAAVALAAAGDVARLDELVQHAASVQTPLDALSLQKAMSILAGKQEWPALLALFGAESKLLLRSGASAAEQRDEEESEAGGRAARRGFAVLAPGEAADGAPSHRWWWPMESYRTILKACRLSADWRCAHSILEELEGIPAAAMAAIVAANEAAAAAAAGATAVRMPVRHQLDAECFAVAMSACLAAGEPHSLRHACERLFPWAEQVGAASGAVYGAAMHACVKLGRRDDAWRLLQRARRRGVELITLELNIGLGAGARAGRLQGALDLLAELRAPGSPCKPDVGSYDALLTPLKAAGRDRELVDLFDEMHSHGLEPLEIHYRLAIAACADLAFGDRAASLLLRMQERGMRFERAAADAIFALNRSSQYRLALDIFEALRYETAESAPATAPAPTAPAAPALAASAATAANSPFVFNGAIEAMRRLGDVQSAVDLVLNMPTRHGVAPDMASFSTALAACREHQRADLLDELLPPLAASCAAAARQFLPSDDVHSELIIGFGLANEPHRALRLFCQLAASERPLSAPLYNATLSTLGRCGQLRFGAAREVLALGLERRAWGEGVIGWGDDFNTLDLRQFGLGWPMVAALHFWLAELSSGGAVSSGRADAPFEPRMAGFDEAGFDEDDFAEPEPQMALLIDDGQREGAAEQRMQMLANELTQLNLEFRRADAAACVKLGVSWALLIDSPLSQGNEPLELFFESPTVAERARGDRAGNESAAEAVAAEAAAEAERAEADWAWEASAGGGSKAAARSDAPRASVTLGRALDAFSASAPTDQIDRWLDDLSLGIADESTWVERTRRRRRAQRRRERSLGLRAPLEPAEEDAFTRRQSSQRGGASRWPQPMPDGAVPWSTPRPTDTRPLDTVIRAARSLRRPRIYSHR